MKQGLEDPAMEVQPILGFLGGSVLKGYIKTGKLVIAIATVSILLDYSLILLKNSFSTNSTDFVNSSEKIKKVVQILIRFEFLNVLPSLAMYQFSLVTMILASAIAHRIKKLSFEDFLSRIRKLCLTTLVMSLYLMLFTTGYISLFSALLTSLMVVPTDHLLILIPLVITFCLYAFIIWTSSVIMLDFFSAISMIEESCSGLHVQGKAEGIVKENRLYGVLKFTFFMALLILTVSNYMSFRGNPYQKPIWAKIIHHTFTAIFYNLVLAVYVVSCTVYVQCKKTQREEIKLQGSSGYDRIKKHISGANWKPLLVMLQFAGVVYLLWKEIWDRLIFQSKTSNADQMFELILASG